MTTSSNSTNPNTRESEVRSALRDEIQTTTAQISDFLRTTDQMLVISIAGLAAIGTYASKLDVTSGRALLIFIPLIVTSISGYAMRAIATIVALGAYRARLEQLLSEQLGINNIFWESRMTAVLRKSGAHLFAELSFIIIIAAAFGTGVWAACSLRFGLNHAEPVLPIPVFVLVLVLYMVMAGGLVLVRIRSPKYDLDTLIL